MSKATFFRFYMILCMFICTLGNLICYAQETIIIKTQNDFDELSSTINKSLANGYKDIHINIYPGTYYYKSDHINLAGKNYPDASIIIKGNRATLVAQGIRHYVTSACIAPFSPDHAFLYLSNDIIDVWSPLYQTEELIEVVSLNSKLCRIKNYSKASNLSHAGSYIQITNWFQSFVYQINKIENEYIYFTADNLAKGYREGWNVNNDYNYGQCYPRYRLSNVKPESNSFFIEDKISTSNNVYSVYECIATRFLVLGYGTNLGIVSIDGISFVGNAHNGELGVFSLLSPSGRVVITNCQFKGIRSSRVVAIGNKNNVSILNCQFEDCSESCIVSSLGAENTIISNCVFVRCGTGLKNSFCVRCYGAGFYVGHNYFEDYGYSAIGIGCGFGEKRKSKISGVVEYNKLRYTDNYFKCKEQHTLMDGGAIYAFTQNDDTEIRYNYIDGYTGMKDNRGVFCDDGASNLKIYGNIITNIDNSYCIDSRRVAAVEEQVGPSNIGNRFYDNIVDGTIRIEGREIEENDCEYGTNYFLVWLDKTMPQNVINNVNVTGEDIILNYTGKKREKVGISRASYRCLKRTSNWKVIKKFVVKKNKLTPK